MHYLTTQEQERHAYITNDKAAAVLARLDDAHRALGDEAAMQAQIDDLQDQVDALRDERDGWAQPYRDALNDADTWHNQAKTYRSALMAIEAEVPAHIRQFIREVLA